MTHLVVVVVRIPKHANFASISLHCELYFEFRELVLHAVPVAYECNSSVQRVVEAAVAVLAAAVLHQLSVGSL